MAAATRSSELFFSKKIDSAGSEYRPEPGRMIVDSLMPFATSTVGRVNAEIVPNDSHCSALQNWIVAKPHPETEDRLENFLLASYPGSEATAGLENYSDARFVESLENSNVRDSALAAQSLGWIVVH